MPLRRTIFAFVAFAATLTAGCSAGTDADDTAVNEITATSAAPTTTSSRLSATDIAVIATEGTCYETLKGIDATARDVDRLGVDAIVATALESLAEPEDSNATREAKRTKCGEGVERYRRGVSGEPATADDASSAAIVTGAYCKTFGKAHVIEHYGSVDAFVAHYPPNLRAGAKAACLAAFTP